MTTRARVIVAAALGVVVVAAYPEVFLGTATFALRDHPVLTVPARAFLHEALWSGRFPGWWDRVGFGVPFAANPVYQALSPVAGIFSLLPQPRGADLEQLAYVWLFGLGTALFSSRLGACPRGAFLAGALAATSGYFGSLIFNGGMPYVPWMPWVAWATDRLASSEGRARSARAAVVLASFGALQLLGPDPGTVLTTAFLALLVLLLRAERQRLVKLGWLAAAGATAVAVAGAALVPAIAFGQGSARSGGFPLETASVWSLHPWRLVELVWPGALGDPATMRNDLGWLVANAARGSGAERSWSFTVFLGVPALVLAVSGAAGNRERRLLLAAAAFLVLALGAYTPAFELLRAVFPPERYLRYPEKHVLGGMLLVWAFAGVGVTRLSQRGSRAVPWSLGIATVLLAAAVATVALRTPALASALTDRMNAVRLSFALDPESALSFSVRQGGLAVAALAAATVGALLARRRALGAAGASLLAAAALATSWRDLRATTPLASRQVTPPAVLASIPAGARIYRDFGAIRDGLGGAASARREYETLAGNVASRFGIGTVPGFDPTPTEALEQLWQSLFPEMTMESVATLLGIQWSLVYDLASPWAMTQPVVARSNRFSLVSYPPVRPRAFATPFGVPAPSQDDALAALALENRDPTAVLIEGPAPAPARGPLQPCRMVSPRPERVELGCASSGGWAVLLDAAAPGWSATVDGRPTVIRRADGLFRAVELPPGSHAVVFEYATPGLRLGIALTAAGIALLLGTAWATRSRAPETAAQ